MGEQAPRHQITIVDSGERYPCQATQTLLAGMERLGKRGIPVGCRGGGCGVCKVRILSGRFSVRKMSRAHISREEEHAGVVLACRCHPDSDIELAVVGKMRKAVCRPETPAAGNSTTQSTTIHSTQTTHSQQ